MPDEPPPVRFDDKEPQPHALGRAGPGVGADVVRLEPASAADQAGLAQGDVITAIGAVQAPTPAQVTRSFGAIPAGQRVVVGVTRGDTHFVTTFQR